MPPRQPGDEPDPAAELLGRWQAHHEGQPGSSGDGPSAEETPPQPPTPSPTMTHTPHPQARPASRRHAGRRRRHDPAPSAPTRAPADRTERATETSPPTSQARPVPLPSPRAAVAAGSADVEFPPRLALRRTLGVVVAALLVVTAGAGVLAYRDPSTLTVGIAGTLLVLTLLLYGVRVTAAPARLAIHSGQLEVVRGSRREVFDLTSRFTRLEVVGKPGRPGWKVLMARFGRDPLVIDSSMVDPTLFTAALERHRPR